MAALRVATGLGCSVVLGGGALAIGDSMITTDKFHSALRGQGVDL